VELTGFEPVTFSFAEDPGVLTAVGRVLVSLVMLRRRVGGDRRATP
jgi:hypothetical protein